MNDFIFILKNKMDFYHYVEPTDQMYTGHPPPYTTSQHKYHSIQYYPYKKPGVSGNYGPRQESFNSTMKHGVYPMDKPSAICQGPDINTRKINIYQIERYVQPLNKYPKY